MTPKTILAVVLVLIASACTGDTPPATEIAIPAAATPVSNTNTAPDTQVDSQTGTPVSECRRLDQPGQYYLATSLTGAPVTVSNTAELAEPYTGDATLEQACIEISAPDVTLDCQGQTLTGADPSGSTAGIFISGRGDAPLSGVTVQRCTITGHQFGLYAGHLEGGKILNNIASRNSNIGFYLIGLAGTEVSGNTAEGNSPDGFLFIGDQNVTLANNTALYNRMRGITFEGCQSCTATGNISHSHGVLGFGIYGSNDMIFEENVAYNNRYHGFAILHEAGSATFRNNESYENEGAGFFLQGSGNNQYTNNLSYENGLDGIVLLGETPNNTFENNVITNNTGYAVFSDTTIDPSTFAANIFSGNLKGEIGNADQTGLDTCAYTGFGPQGPCDPVFEGGPNLKDPGPGGQPTAETAAPAEPTQPTGAVITDARFDGDPVYYPSMGDLWMSTWADDGRLYMTWGDGTGFGDGFPTTYPSYQTDTPITIPACGDEYFPCQLWCNVFSCSAGEEYPPAPLTDAGILWFEGQVPNFTGVENVAIDIPEQSPFFIDGPAGGLDVQGRNDKPSSLLYLDGRLYLAGHSPAGFPVLGYIAYSDDNGRTWTEMPNSPWGENSVFRVLMFVNMGQNYNLNQDGYVYAYGVGSEAQGIEGWSQRTVYLARVSTTAIADYSAYQYFTGFSGTDPQWSSVESEAVPLDNLHTTGQGSAMYHEGTGRYLFLTSDAGPPDGPTNSGALFEAPQPWGPWTEVAVLCFVPECNEDGRFPEIWTDSKYIAGLIPKDAGPNYVYFTISGGDDHYQLQIGRLELITR